MKNDPLQILIVDQDTADKINSTKPTFINPNIKSRTPYNSAYVAGMRAERKRVKISLWKRRKYARMWAKANAFQIPNELSRPLHPKDPYLQGAFAVLELLRKDGIIPQELVDTEWDKL